MPSASIPSVIASSVRADRRSASAHRTREPTVASTRAISARMRSWRSPYRSPVLFAAQRTRGASFCAAPSRPHWSLLITAWVSSRTWLASGTVALDGARAVPLRRVISRLPATLHDGIREQIDRPSTLVTDRLTCPRLCRISRNPQLAGGSYLPVRKTLQGEIHPRVGPSMERDPPVRRDHPEEDRRAEVPLRRLPPTGLTPEHRQMGTELVENRRRSIAMLPSGVPALDRDEALEVLGQPEAALLALRKLRAQGECGAPRALRPRRRGHLDPAVEDVPPNLLGTPRR